MTNTLVTSSIVARETLAILKNMLSFSANVNRDYQDEFKSNMARGYAPGQTINIRKPPRYTYRVGRFSVPQATFETTIPLTLSQGGVDINFTSLERTLSLVDLENKLEAAIAPVANEIDRQGLELARFATFNTINVAGALPVTQAAALAIATDANRKMDEMLAPRDRRRNLITNPALNGAMIQGFAGLFNSQTKLSKQYDSGMMVDSLGLAYGMDQNVSVHTNGAATATNINGAGQTGSAITVVAVAAGTLARGTVITLPGVFAVNAQSRQSTGVLAMFVVTADALVGATTINVSPALVVTGSFQNVTASPTTGSPYVIQGAASTAYAANVAYHKDAFTLAMVPMWRPEGLGAKVSQRSEDGFTVKVTEYYDGTNDVSNMRVDVLFGWAATYPELAVKIYTLN
jgi:hypothetical protein